MQEKKENVKRKKEDILKKWEGKKKINKEIADKLITVGETSRGYRMEKCSEQIILSKCPKCGKKHISKAELCRDRVCPICQWRLSKQRAYEMLLCLQYMNLGTEYKYQFLTLTQKNIHAYKLRDELKKMNEGWKRIISSHYLNQPCGFARVIEITYNEKSKMFHPHQHIIICWKTEQKPLKRKEWAEKWKKALRLNYEPIVRLQYIRPKKGKTEENTSKYVEAVLETYKYSVKSKDILTMDNETFKIFINQIKGTRVTSYTGIFKKTRKELKMKNSESIEDINLRDTTCEDCGADLINAVMQWSYADERYIEIMRKEKEKDENRK